MGEIYPTPGSGGFCWGGAQGVLKRTEIKTGSGQKNIMYPPRRSARKLAAKQGKKRPIRVSVKKRDNLEKRKEKEVPT